jgi:hypothetical protein
MLKFEFIATKGFLPKNLKYVKQGYVFAKSEINARKRLEFKYRFVQIIRRVSA